MAINSENAGLRLSVQRALLGTVSPNLYGACADLRDDVLVLTWYIATGMPADEREDLQAAATEVIADYPEGYHVDERSSKSPTHRHPSRPWARGPSFGEGSERSTPNPG